MLLAVLVVALTAAATYFSQTLPAGGAKVGVEYPSANQESATTATAHAVIVEGGDPTYNFGIMPQYSAGSHTWILKNEGTSDLLMSVGYKSCSCTIADLAEGQTAKVKPGATTTVTLTWNTKDARGKYNQRAEILTPTDSARQKYEFSIAGTVSPALVTIPPGNVMPFTEVANSESHKGQFALFSPDRPSTTITSLTSSNPKRIEVSYEPLSESELKELDVKAGYHVFIVLKKGMPLGEFREEVIVQTDHPKQKELRMEVSGKVVGPISIMPERVRISAISGDKPTSQTVTLWVRRKDVTKFEVIEAPRGLKVEIAEVLTKAPQTDQRTNARRYRLTVTVPSDMPPALIDSKIRIKTDDPSAPELTIPVNLTIKSAEG
jgi:hypothetical protein